MLELAGHRSTAKHRSVVAGDVTGISSLLERAFRDDPGLRYVIPDETEWDRIAPTWFQRTLRYAMKFGLALTDTGQRGVSLWERPGFKPSFSGQILELLQTTFLFRGNLPRAFEVQASTQRYRPRQPFWYLAYLATDPGHQRNGVGASLLRPMLDAAASDGFPVYLECSNRDNLSFYVAQGFSIIDEIQLPGGPSIWPMRRDPHHGLARTIRELVHEV